MKQSEMLAVLKELRSDLLRYAAGSDSIVPGAYEEALDAAIETLGRMMWRSVKDRLPEDDSPVLTVYSNPYGEMVLALNDYNTEYENPWCDSGREKTLYWMPIPPLPEALDEEDAEDKQ